MVKLEYSKIIRRRLHKDGRLRGEDLDRGRRQKGGAFLTHNIRCYEIWFRYLKLALELEKQGYTFVKRIRKDTKGTQSKMGTKSIPIKVRSSAYKEWNLDEVLKNKFEDWFKKHRHLFKECTLIEITDKNQIEEDLNLITIQIDKRKKTQDLVTDFKYFLKDKGISGAKNEKKRWQQKTAEYQITGSIHLWTQLIRYQILIMKLQGKSNKEIRDYLIYYIEKSVYEHELDLRVQREEGIIENVRKRFTPTEINELVNYESRTIKTMLRNEYKKQLEQFSGQRVSENALIRYLLKAGQAYGRRHAVGKVDRGMLYFNDDVIKKHYERAKETLLTVADGYFVTNTSNKGKKYFC